MSIYISGVVVDNKGKEKLLRLEIESLRKELSDMEHELKAKYEECEWLIEKIHKLGGRLRK